MAACRVAGLHEYCFSQRENGLLEFYCRTKKYIFLIILVLLSGGGVLLSVGGVLLSGK
ncbi:Uncharacterized protein APZ42_006765 [Daphnia magna]|uniref:Uncharacterized protein n=1 Tax=Daphnia magna TaxID=35525 RepID=A0A162D316_9CRUS|nr:Uncharacterized protein APZ42_006765 [Daphnia magna]